MPRSKRRLERSPSESSLESAPESTAECEQRYARLRVGHIAAVPVVMDDEIRMCLALVAEAPTESSVGEGWMIETTHDIRAEAGTTEDENILMSNKGRFLSNTPVGLDTAYAMAEGYEALAGLYWETELGNRALLPMTSHYRQYLEEVRKHGLQNAVPAACQAIVQAALSRGSPKSDAHVRKLCNLLGRHVPEMMPFSVSARCIACGAIKHCTKSLDGQPLGADCAAALASARPACVAVRRLQGRKRLPYPHDFQALLEDESVIGA